jgi:hypothetical protein
MARNMTMLEQNLQYYIQHRRYFQQEVNTIDTFVIFQRYYDC